MYKPGPVPTGTLSDTQRYLRTELQRIASQMAQDSQDDTEGVTLQSCSVFSGTTPSIAFSTETGWSVTQPAAGIYEVTFPSVASGDRDQVVVASPLENDATEVTVGVRDLWADRCRIKLANLSGASIDRDFMLMRTL